MFIIVVIALTLKGGMIQIGIVSKIEVCPWCNRKTVGVTKEGVESCVKCEYKKHDGMSTHDFMDQHFMMKIYEEMVCCKKRKSHGDHGFTLICDKLKGHKGPHKDSEWPELSWESNESED